MWGPGYSESSYEPSFMPMCSYESTGPMGERSPQEMVTEPQVQWWAKKINEHNASNSAYKLRSVGSMRPTNLGPTQPKGCRNKAREQRVKFQDQRLIPDVPRPLKEQAAEQEFEAEVWNNAGRRVSESVVGLLGLDDFDDFDPLCDPRFHDAGTHAPVALDTMDEFDEVDGNAASSCSAVQSTFWDPQYPGVLGMPLGDGGLALDGAIKGALREAGEAARGSTGSLEAPWA
eukprot:Skav225210  [mRNA]  locus=scaffold1041:142015:143934:- [translate_table: standard]